jgi:hypothetical protein
MQAAAEFRGRRARVFPWSNLVPLPHAGFPNIKTLSS